MSKKEEFIFSEKAIGDSLYIWNSAAILLFDIRHRFILPKEEIKNYRIPANAFIYTGKAKAEVYLDDTSYQVERYGLFHGGKGTEISISPIKDRLECYMVFYKAGEPTFHNKREFKKRLERVNPFQLQYGFAPSNPLFFAELLRIMYERFTQPLPFNLFYGKTAFYQLVCEIYEELSKKEVQILQPETVSMMKRYMDKYYFEKISIQMVAQSLGVSQSHLRSRFKEKYGVSPQEYLTSVRIQEVKKHLTNSDVLLKEIAQRVGFYDEFQMSRLFKKQEGISPYAFKAKHTYRIGDVPMEHETSFHYNEESQVSLDELKGRGVNIMLKQMKNKAVVAATLTLVMMLSACGTTAANTSDTKTPSTTEAVSEAQTTKEAQQETRTITTSMGDVEVPANPQRVIATYGMGDILALGVTPVATYDAKGAAYEKEVAQLPVWGNFETEEIMSYNPDLLLVAGQEQYDAVSKIAPTILIPFTDLSMEERITYLGQILNKEEEAKKVLSDFKEKIENAKKELEEKEIKDQTFSIFEADGNGGVWVYGDKWGRGGDLLYSQLGLNAPQIIKDEIIGKDQYRQVSMESIGDYAGDYIVFSGELGDLSDNPVWNSIPAVKEGKVIPIDYTLFYDIDIYSSNVQLDYIMEKLKDITK